jgi:methionine transaminase
MTAMANEYNAINLSQGFPDFDVDPTLIDLVNFYMKKGHNQYAPMPGVPKLNLALSHKYKECYGVDYKPASEITITSGATQALATAFSTLVNPQDEVIVFEPAYDAYTPLIRLNGGKAIPLELSAPDFKPDWQEVAKAISPKTKAIVVNTPHNPCGSMFNQDDINTLAELIRGKNIYIISDEVYEHITFDGVKHLSLCMNEELRKVSFIISSFGKSFHTTGWKCGYCLAPEALTKEFRKIHQFFVYSVNTPVQFAYAEYLETPENYLKVSAFYQAKRDLVLKALSKSPFKYKPATGSYFQLIDFSLVSKENGLEFTKRLTKEAGVALIPLEPFYESSLAPSFVRICFAKKDQTLTEGINRLSDFC